MTDIAIVEPVLPPPPAAPTVGDLYTIFDKRQKRLIAFLVTVAGTWKSSLATSTSNQPMVDAG